MTTTAANDMLDPLCERGELPGSTRTAKSDHVDPEETANPQRTANLSVLREVLRGGRHHVDH